VRESVLADAVRAYTLARKRGLMQKSSSRGHRRIGREEIEALAREFPEAYSMNGGQNLVYTGRSADDILEDHLQGIGKPRRSKIWFELAGIVVARGERVLEGGGG
tara:strand:- start:8805 stop:9119 length:315 start_codon:yes stop_codon:yes gene_type:complete